MPVFNEKLWVEEIVGKVIKQNVEGVDALEIIIVDDGSTDGTRDILKNLENSSKVIYHEKNKGKGGAMKTGVKAPA